MRANAVTSSTWPEYLIKDVAEPCLKHIKFCLRNGKRIRPVIDDGPISKVMFDGAANTRRCALLRIGIEIVRQRAGSGASSMLAASIYGAIRHNPIIARSAQISNALCTADFPLPSAALVRRPGRLNTELAAAASTKPIPRPPTGPMQDQMSLIGQSLHMDFDRVAACAADPHGFGDRDPAMFPRRLKDKHR